GPAGSPEAAAALADAVFALPPAEAGPVGLPANAGGTDGAGSVPNAAPSIGALPAGTLEQAPGPRALLPNAELSLGAGSKPSDFSRFLNGDGDFLELWDRDQLLFSDSLRKVVELHFPGGRPGKQETPLPQRTPNLDGPLSLGERPVEAPASAGAVGKAAESAPALPDGQEAVAEPALAATAGDGLALSSPDANRPEASPADRPDTGRGAEPLRPYKSALGLAPVLPAFGFTAVTLREHVQTGLRWWRKLRGRRRRGR